MEEDWLKRRGVIVFVKYKGTARALAEDINAQLGDVAQAIHTVEDEDTSDGQGDRTSVGERTLRMFSDRCRKNHKIPVVVSTDRLAEGIGAPWASALVHWHVPKSPNSLSSEIGVLTGGWG